LLDTTRQAKEKDVNITYELVRDTLKKLKHRQTHFKYNRFNSYISPKPLFEIELDLIDLTSKAEKDNGYRYGLVGIDNFTKYADIIPMRSKTADEIIDAVKELLNKIGIPKQIYSDQEPAFSSPKFVRLMNEHKIKHIATVGKAHTVERFNRTIKEKMTTRLEALDEGIEQWHTHINDVINKYNNSEHRTIKMTPNQARKKGNEMLVRFNIYDNAKMNRKYPPIEIGSSVRVLLREDNKTKGYHSKYNNEIYKVLDIKGNDYLVNDNKHKLYLRYELLKV